MDDPFTRRSTKPRMVYKPDDGENPEIIPEVATHSVRPIEKISTSNEKENSQKVPKKQSTEDLFNAHNFDITIDLEVPIPSKYITIEVFFFPLPRTLNDAKFLLTGNPVSILPKPINNIKDTGPRRSLNLEDYKKKRGLI